MKNIGYVLIFSSLARTAFANSLNVPEIDASTGVAAVTLLSGAMLVLRSRRRR